MLVERVVEIGDICLVMLVVVNLHRLRVDLRLECREVVGQRGKGVFRVPAGGRLLFLDLCHCGRSLEVCTSNPALRGTVPPISCSAERAVLSHSGGARGGVSPALA